MAVERQRCCASEESATSSPGTTMSLEAFWRLWTPLCCIQLVVLMHAEVSAEFHVLGVHRSRGKMSSSTAIISSNILAHKRSSWTRAAGGARTRVKNGTSPVSHLVVYRYQLRSTVCPVFDHLEGDAMAWRWSDNDAALARRVRQAHLARR